MRGGGGSCTAGVAGAAGGGFVIGASVGGGSKVVFVEGEATGGFSATTVGGGTGSVVGGGRAGVSWDRYCAAMKAYAFVGASISTHSPLVSAPVTMSPRRKVPRTL